MLYTAVVEEIRKTHCKGCQCFDNCTNCKQNPKDENAWKLIDQCNLRNYSIGDAKVSQIHTNFLINEKNATFNDMYNLIYYVKRKVKEKFNIELKPEIKIITTNNICPRNLQIKE